MKIALCLFGLVGSDKGKSYDKMGNSNKVLRECYKSFSSKLFKHNDVDVFFHTWDQEFEDELVAKYKPKDYKTEQQIIFEDTIKGPAEYYKRIQAHYSRWYSTNEVNKLKLKYELANGFKYDFVMISRFDMIWKVDIKFNDLNKNIFYIPGTFKDNIEWGWPKAYSGLNIEIDDLWYLSSSSNMDKFCNLYKYINTYLKVDKCRTHKSISNHMLAFHHLNKIGLIPNNTQRLYKSEATPSYGKDHSDYLVYRYLKNLKLK